MLTINSSAFAQPNIIMILLLKGIADTEKPLDMKIKTHVFREEHKSKHISPKKFTVRPKY